MSELEKLRELLFAEEQKTLQSIKQRTESPGTRTRDVAEVLPGAIGASHRNDPGLVKALREPVRECFEYSVNSNPRAFADALFPVIGPAIRKSIAETFKSLVQSLNQTMEYSLSPRGLKWRMEAARAGIPLGEYILRKTLVYRIEQVYLIQRERGLMAGHVQNESAVVQDADAVSAMFTAIQDFVSDSFSPDQKQQLETADIGEFTVWVLHGPYSMMACVIRGVPPRGLRDELSEILERINLQYGDALKDFDGDLADLEGADDLLAECLSLEQREVQEENGKGGLSPPLKIALLLLIGLLAWVLISGFLENRRLERFREAVTDTPGLLATELEVDGRNIRMRGLSDPLADDMEAVLERAGLGEVTVAAELHAFQSLEPEMVLRRARQVLAPPDTVQLALQGDTLVATGSAGAAWRRLFETRAPNIAGVVRADASATLPGDDALLRQARSLLAPPAGVTMQVTQQTLNIAGSAPQAWIDDIPARLASLDGLEALVTEGLTATELGRLQSLVRELDGRAFYFQSGANPLDARGTALASAAARLREALALADLLGRPLSVRIIGHADGVGGPARNLEIMRQRARVVLAGLEANGIPGDRLRIDTASLPDDPRVDAEERRAVLRLSLSPDPSP